MSEKQSVVTATGIAAALAIVILLVAVLPAEYGLDPLGTGQALGLTGMADPNSSALETQPRHWVSNQRAFKLHPFESLEYKYHLTNGAAMVFSWEADGDLVYDMHSEPDGAAPGYAESFGRGRARQQNGSYTAPFDGIHGWYWQNRGQTTVHLRLNASGFFSAAREMRDGKQVEASLNIPVVKSSAAKPQRQ